MVGDTCAELIKASETCTAGASLSCRPVVVDGAPFSPGINYLQANASGQGAGFAKLPSA